MKAYSRKELLNLKEGVEGGTRGVIVYTCHKYKTDSFGPAKREGTLALEGVYKS